MSRKRKAPVASSVVRVNRSADEDSDDAEEEDTECGGRGLSSRVSLPSKPERKSVLKVFTRIFMIVVVYIFSICPRSLQVSKLQLFGISILHPAGFHHNPALYCFRPTLPPAKQANRNLILKAISEAQDSITKTTAFPSSTHI